MTAVVTFPMATHANPAALIDQRWNRADLPANVVTLREPPEPYRVPQTPERALLRAIVSQLTPKAYTGLLTRLARQREKGCPYSGVAFLIATERLDGPT